MKVEKVLKQIVFCLVFLVSAVAAEAGLISTQEAVEPGKWSSDYNAAMAYAEKNNMPLVVFWANVGCGNCNKIETEMNATEDFQNWKDQLGALMVFVESDSKVKSWIKANSRTKLKKYPYMAVYWPKNASGEKVLEGFSAYKGEMSLYGANKADSNVKQIMDTVDYLLTGWNSEEEDVPLPPGPTSYTVTFVVDSSKATVDGALKQTVEEGAGVTAPAVTAKEGWTFKGWDTSFDAVTSDLVVTALFGDALGREEVDLSVLYKKSQKLEALAYQGDSLFGKVLVTLGKYNAKKDYLKVTFKITSFGGKSYTKSVSKVTPTAFGDILDVEVPFKSPVGYMVFNIVNSADGLKVSGVGDQYSVEEGTVVLGGILQKENMLFSVDFDSIEAENESYDFIMDLPKDVSAVVKRGKTFSFGSSPMIKYEKIRENGSTRYELADWDKARYPNVNAVKLTYKSTTGTFSGSFKIYASNKSSIEEGKKPKIKKYTAKFNGYVIDGKGEGTVSVKIGKKTYTGTCSLD